jgi:hypothetical protein
MSTTSTNPVLESLQNLVYQTPIGPILNTCVNSTIVDFVDATIRAEKAAQLQGEFTWFDGASAYFFTAITSLIHLIQDLAFAFFNGLAALFSEQAKKNFKIHLMRSGIDVTGFLASCVGIIFPRKAGTAAVWILSQMPSQPLNRLGGYFDTLHKKIVYRPNAEWIPELIAEIKGD